MGEGFEPQKQKPTSPWAVEPGSPVDELEKKQKREKDDRAFEKETLRALQTQLNELVKKDGAMFEVDGTVRGVVLSTDTEYFSLFTTHIQHLLKDANGLLEQHQKSFRIRAHLTGAQGEGMQAVELTAEKK